MLNIALLCLTLALIFGVLGFGVLISPWACVCKGLFVASVAGFVASIYLHSLSRRF